MKRRRQAIATPSGLAETWVPGMKPGMTEKGFRAIMFLYCSENAT